MRTCVQIPSLELLTLSVIFIYVPFQSLLSQYVYERRNASEVSVDVGALIGKKRTRPTVQVNCTYRITRQGRETESWEGEGYRVFVMSGLRALGFGLGSPHLSLPMQAPAD